MIAIMLSYITFSAKGTVDDGRNAGNDKLNKIQQFSGNYRDMKLPIGVELNLLKKQTVDWRQVSGVGGDIGNWHEDGAAKISSSVHLTSSIKT